MNCICLFLEKILEKIVDISTIVATVVAIIGIIQTQIQFRKNMKLQNCSINLSLFDDRTSIFEQIKKKDFSFSRDRFSLLFNEELVSLVSKYDQVSQDLGDYASIIRQFASCLCDMSSNDDGKTPNFPDLLWKYDNLNPGENCSQSEHEEVTKILKDTPLKIKIECMDFEYHTYNYVDLTNKSIELSQELNRIHETLVKKIKEFIQSSISNGENSKK